jgi:hypothetical protein
MGLLFDGPSSGVGVLGGCAAGISQGSGYPLVRRRADRPAIGLIQTKTLTISATVADTDRPYDDGLDRKIDQLASVIAG